MKCHRPPWLLLGVWMTSALLLAGDLSVVPLWDGETVDQRTVEDNRLANRFGGQPRPGYHVTVAHTTNTVRSGRGALRLDGLQVASGGYDYAGLAFSGYYGNEAYVDTRDLTPFREIRFALRNETGAPCALALELKDYRESNDHRALRHFTLGPDAAWTNLAALLPPAGTNGWDVIGTPDFSRAKLLLLVFEASQGAPVNGAILLDDLALVEAGPPLDVENAPVRDLVERLARRQFAGLWGLRDRATGLLPMNSAYADVVALNVTAGLLQSLPVAVAHGWVSPDEADLEVARVVASLHTAMDLSRSLHQSGRLPPRYLDRVTLPSCNGSSRSSWTWPGAGGTPTRTRPGRETRGTTPCSTSRRRTRAWPD